MDGQGRGQDCLFNLGGLGGLGELGELGVLGANPFWGGEENRAKDAKDAKVKGKKDEEIAGVVVEGRLLCESKCRGDKGRGRGRGQLSTVPSPFVVIPAYSWLKILHPSLKTHAFNWNHE